MNYIKSPLNYTGGKYKLLPQILPLFPNDINVFLDMFCGSGEVGLNVSCKKVILNDINQYILSLLESLMILDEDYIFNRIDGLVMKYSLSKENKDGFLRLREDYNLANGDNWDMFLLLVFHSFNNQMRFNNKHKYNSSFGDRTYNESTKKNLLGIIRSLKSKSVEMHTKDFRDIDIGKLKEKDFAYLDPPYLISTATYNDGKRGFKGWTEKDECDLLELLDVLNNNKIKFALSNVLEHKGKSNDILKEWCEKNKDKYIVHHLNHTYSNCNYHDKTGTSGVSDEILICNYVAPQTISSQCVK